MTVFILKIVIDCETFVGNSANFKLVLADNLWQLHGFSHFKDFNGNILELCLG